MIRRPPSPTPGAAPVRQDRPLVGIACMVGGMVLLVLSDASAKWLAEYYSVTQVVALRGLFIIAGLGIICLRTQPLRVVNLSGHCARAAFAVASSFLFVYGLSYLPLAEATAAAFVGPLFLTALAGPLLRERVGMRRWGAVIAGFGGVLLMLRPGGDLNWYILLPVAAACFGALRDVVTRHISTTDNATSILFTTNVVTVAVGMLFASTWTMPSLPHVGLLAVSALLIGSAHYLHIEAFRLAEAATVAPFRYSGIVWGVVFGFVFFGKLPGPWVIAGGGVVVASGLYIMRRERARKRGQ